MLVMTMNAGGTTMLKQIAYAAVFVNDQGKALDFYTKVLGFEKGVDAPTPNGPRFLTVGVKGQDFQLVLWPGTPGQGQPAYGRMSAAYTIDVGDCRKMFEVLKSRGVKFATDVLEYPWGSVAVFQDPDGNPLQLREAR
jgi:predicted enzyme related to lactoylglutathione lyase